MKDELLKHNTATIELEEYEIVYRHYYVNSKGERHPLEDPIVCRQVAPIGESGSQPWLINEMMEKLKDYVVQRVGRKYEG